MKKSINLYCVASVPILASLLVNLYLLAYLIILISFIAAIIIAIRIKRKKLSFANKFFYISVLAFFESLLFVFSFGLIASYYYPIIYLMVFIILFLGVLFGIKIKLLNIGKFWLWIIGFLIFASLLLLIYKVEFGIEDAKNREASFERCNKCKVIQDMKDVNFYNKCPDCNVSLGICDGQSIF